MNAKNQDFVPPPKNSSFSRNNNSNSISFTSFNKNSSDSDADGGFDSLMERAKNPSTSRYNAPKKEDMFQKESSIKTSRPQFNRSLNRQTNQPTRQPLKPIGRR